MAQGETQSVSSGLAFRPSDDGGFTFDTGVVKGRLREGGISKGLTQVIHTPSGVRLDASMGLLSHYRVFTTGHRYGVGAWDWPGLAVLTAEGAVETRWPTATNRPFEMTARYQWIAPNTIEVLTSVVARTNLSKFESFVASYFSSAFTNALVCAGEGGSFVPALKGDGVWQAFPRDEAAKLILQDGRWKLEPHPVDWILRPQLTHAIALRRAPHPGLTAALMADRRECFAICTPHQEEAHYSTYLSLFGRHLRAGEKVEARARLIISPRLSEEDAMKLSETLNKKGAD